MDEEQGWCLQRGERTAAVPFLSFELANSLFQQHAVRLARSLRIRQGMSRKVRWIASIAAGIAAVPAGYVAELLMSGSCNFGAIVAITNAFALVP